MKTLLLAVLLASLSTAALAGNCNYPNDRASDGSRCGERASSERAGGSDGSGN